jgi:hypothetical protein
MITPGSLRVHPVRGANVLGRPGGTETKPARLSKSAVGPERLLTNVGSPPPFALSLSKGQAELVLPIALSLSKGAFVPRAKGFDRLSPNGSLQTVNFAFGP